MHCRLTRLRRCRVWSVTFMLLFASLLPISAAATAACEEGILPGGALYRVCVPDTWNQQLVLYAHGYVAPNQSLHLPDDDLALSGGQSVSNLLTGLGYAFATTASTNFFRVFGVDMLGVHGLLHKILPSLTYTYTPAFDFGAFPAVTGIPSYARTNNIGFALNQEIEAKIGEEDQKHNILRFNLNSGFDFIRDSLNNVNFLISAPYNPLPSPVTTFNAQVDGRIDPYTRDYSYSISNNFGIKFDFLTLNIGQSYQRGGNYQIWFSGDIKPTRHWVLTYAARYDWQSGDLVNYSFGLARDLHCWEAVFNFNQLGDDWRYDFKIRIKEIPEVSIGKGLLGYIFE